MGRSREPRPRRPDQPRRAEPRHEAARRGHRSRRLDRRRRIPGRDQPDLRRQPAEGSEAKAHPDPRPSPAPTPRPARRRRPRPRRRRHPRPTRSPRPTPTPTPHARRPRPCPDAHARRRRPAAPRPCPAPRTARSSRPTNVWNARIDGRPVAADSATLIGTIGLDRGLHMDFGSYAGYGIPYNIVSTRDAALNGHLRLRRRVRPRRLPDPGEPEDRGRLGRPHPDRRQGRLPALRAVRRPPGRRRLGGRQRRDLGPALERAPAGRLDQRRRRRPADPARPRPLRRGRGRGDPHALRFTAPQTRRAYVYPARHYASSSTSLALPPMGLRVRLKSTSTRAGLSPQPGSSPRRSSATG